MLLSGELGAQNPKVCFRKGICSACFVLEVSESVLNS